MTSAATLSPPPPGWAYGPSRWRTRLVIVALALTGASISVYLTLYQLEVIDTMWEPFFGEGSREILRESAFSRFFLRLGISDAALGAGVYLVDAVAGVIGGTDRWRSKPWIVLVFGIFIGPFGLVSVMLIIIQPVLFGNFCTLCIASALVSLAMIGPAMDEVLATLQHLRRQRDGGVPLMQTVFARV